ncbi:MAG: radical SAM protein [Treponema sp.]|jgi:pyruvate formate lyase activating enzyme|nr:radical SAM protein [Treponema sp.]
MVCLRKTSLVDYPGKVGAVLFFAGCGLRCPWCQNRDLVPGAPRETGEGGPSGGLGRGDKRSAFMSVEKALAHLEKRRAVLGGVVLSGGEPLMQADAAGIAAAVKRLGLPVKLDTNGMHPGVLEALCSHEASRPQYIALDLKLSPGRYGRLLPGGVEDAPDSRPGEALMQSAALIHALGIAHEYRTLVLPQGYIGPGDIRALAPLVDGAPWYFRPFIPGNCLDPAWNSLPRPAATEGEALIREARRLGKNPSALF